jgi:hypothetical protein
MSGRGLRLRAHWDRALAWLLISCSAAAIFIGWLRVSAAGWHQEQLSYLVSGGFGGLLVLGIGATLLLAADLHDLGGKTGELSSVGSGAFRFDPPPRRGPSSMRPVAVTLAATWIVATAALGVGWGVAAGAPDDRSAVPGVTVGVLALLVCAGGGAVALILLRRRVLLDKAAVVPAITAWLAERPASIDLSDSTTTPSPGAVRSDVEGRVLVGMGLRHYHRAGCPALVEVEARSVPRSAVPSGVAPCGICEVR